MRRKSEGEEEKSPMKEESDRGVGKVKMKMRS